MSIVLFLKIQNNSLSGGQCPLRITLLLEEDVGIERFLVIELVLGR